MYHTLVVRGLCLASKGRETMPRVGLATDLRTLRHLGEMFREDNCKTLMCFICSCKHLYHHGYDKFGVRYSKDNIDYRTNSNDLLARTLRGVGDLKQIMEVLSMTE